ncbi:glycogen debranching enzyme N-terminal domain-containing protein [Candidatus Micrarchaeota archaeon]|nr:glycogen debranching enzyme N-terminal domain-containing protein [Candidatus Micrarchaeota archaeon]
MISLTLSELSSDAALQREWVISNGLGGYASSSVIGMNTRKYHGLLVAAGNSPAQRTVLLSKYEETLDVGGSRSELSTNAYPGAVHPRGFQEMLEFRHDFAPTFVYKAGEHGTLHKRVCMVRRKNATLATYALNGVDEATLYISPLLCGRGMHGDGGRVSWNIVPGANGFRATKPHQLYVRAQEGKFVPDGKFYSNVEYGHEKLRGYPYSEDLFCPGTLEIRLEKGKSAHVLASSVDMGFEQAIDTVLKEGARDSQMLRLYYEKSGVQKNDFAEALVRAADTFVFKSGAQYGIVAGYHWFGEWGRDALVAFEGICLSTGRYGLARKVLLRYAQLAKQGQIPNLIDENGQPQYNSADAAMWFLNALHAYCAHTHDYGFVEKNLWEAAKDIVRYCIRGNGMLAMNDDGLLNVKDGTGTWMDAKIDGKAITPRNGKPVEINALWHSNLVMMRGLAERFGESKNANTYREAAKACRESFSQFWNPDAECLYDVIEPYSPKVRPNQIYAVSVPFSPLNELQQRMVLNAVRMQLFTPLGLRSLSQKDAEFAASYTGDQQQRDRAYHNGAIWPFLLGAFADAHLKVFPNSEATVLRMMMGFDAQMRIGCIGSIGEIFDNKTHAPVGAASQAWSVAEVLRVYTKCKKAVGSGNGAWKENPLFEKSRVQMISKWSGIR